jgi:mono/diheme cytochrome c family protein
MPRGNGIKLLLLAGSLVSGAISASGQERPIIIGYERFHSDSPSVEGGRILYNELGCVNCHDRESGLPERKGPELNGILERSHPDWVRSFLKHPSQHKPGTNMPNFHLEDQEVEAVMHYLASIAPEKELGKAFKFVNAERGMALYHDFGCAACHEPSPDFYPADGKPDPGSYTYPHVALPELKQKYDIDSLSAFLYNTHLFRPSGRMPQFALDREDGGDLAAHLLDFQNGDATYYPSIPKFESKESLADLGRTIVEARNCVACHTISGAKDLIPEVFPISSGISLDGLKNHPDYSLGDGQIQSLERFLNNSPTVETPALTQLQALNCMACHDRDGSGGPDIARRVYFSGDHDLGDTGRYPPPLTEIGRKLQPEWLQGVLDGKNKVRPYLQTQMPVFGRSVKGLASALARDDQSNSKIDFPEGHGEVGQKLLGTIGGLNCITCHNWGERRSLGIKALDLSNMTNRLQLDWLHDYLINPAEYRSNTLMPSFWPNGQASNTDILAGNTKAQIASIYEFAKSGIGIPEGFPDQNSTAFEIIPTDRPVVQRSFMAGIGTHALLVGFPEGIHLAFDGQSGEPAILWKGRFFDAYRTWYSRFPEFENPLGSDIVFWPISENEGERKYRGYRLDSAGIPEFVLELNGSQLFERYIPKTDESGTSGMQRVIRYTRESQLKDPRLRHPDSVTTIELPDQDPMTRTFLYQW